MPRVDSDDGSLAGCGLDDVEIADDACEPRVAVTREAQVFGLPSRGRCITVRSVPSLGNRTLEPSIRHVFGCGSQKPRESRPFRFHRGARASLVKHRCQARSSSTSSCEQTLRGTSASHGRGAKLGQFVDLVEGRREPSLVVWTGEPIVRCSRRGSRGSEARPPIPPEPRNLRSVRVDTETKSLDDCASSASYLEVARCSDACNVASSIHISTHAQAQREDGAYSPP